MSNQNDNAREIDPQGQVHSLIEKRIALLAESNQLKAEAQRIALQSGSVDLMAAAKCW